MQCGDFSGTVVLLQPVVKKKGWGDVCVCTVQMQILHSVSMVKRSRRLLMLCLESS